MRVFLDTNILLDVFLEREPFCLPAQKIWVLSEKKKIKAAISALSVSHVYFIIQKLSSRDKAGLAVIALLKMFKILEVNSQIIRKAHQSHFPDFEDAIQYFCALKFRSQAIVTRDPDGFIDSVIPVLDPVLYLSGHPMQ